MSVETILADHHIVTEAERMEALENFPGIPRVKINQFHIKPQTVKLLPTRLLRQHEILPVEVKDGKLTLAMVNPLNYSAIDDVSIYTSMEVIPVIAGQQEILTAIRQFSALQVDPVMEKILAEIQEADPTEQTTNKKSVDIDNDAPIIRMVNSIIEQAVQIRASDIHVEPQDDSVRIRLRIDGHLYEVYSLPVKSYPPLISRLKIMGNLDIAEKRLPQDGRFKLLIDKREIDFRISSLPSMTGEKIVLRILDRNVALLGIEEIGFSLENHKKIIGLLARPHGMLLVTGPTGSGKTTTMYSFLQHLNSVDRNIVTLEDPVEYSLSGINQVQINIKAGLTFPNGLRSVVRQDPDIIMVGEMRDNQTAELGIRAAMTGHLLLSTLHTNSAVGTIARLVNMGIENYLLSSAIVGIVYQRLVRKLCPNCCQSYWLDKGAAFKLGLPAHGVRLFRAEGCNMCRHTGYAGRIALHEVLEIGPLLCEAVNKGVNSEDELQLIAVQAGMKTIKEDGLSKAEKGITSLEEVMKVVYLGG